MSAKPLVRLMPDDQLGLLIDAFLDDGMLAGLSERTIQFYRGNLERFHWWCEETGTPLDPERLTPVHLRQFLRYLQSDARWDSDTHAPSVRKLSPSSLDAYYRSLRRFFNWCIEQEILEQSPLAKVQSPKVPDQQPEPFTASEVAALFTAIDERGGRYRHRDRAILAVLLDVGLRISELCNLTVDDVFASGEIVVRQGKGGKSRTVVLGATARRMVRTYLYQDRMLVNPMAPIARRQKRQVMEGWFFLARGDRQLTRNAVRLMLNKLGAATGISPVNPHRFRHTAALNAVRAGMDTLHVQMMLGHTDLTMTRRYVKLAQTDMEHAARRHSPLDYLSRG